MKKAFLVEVVTMTRVVVDVPEDFDGDYHYYKDEEKNRVCDMIFQEGIDKMRRNPNDYICFDNAIDFHEDREMPYDPTQPCDQEES